MKFLTAFIFSVFMMLGVANANSNVSVIIDGEAYQCSKGGTTTTRSVTFYRGSDCASNAYNKTYDMFSIDSVEMCERLRTIDAWYDRYIYSVKIDGQCQYISTTQFVSACEKYLLK